MRATKFFVFTMIIATWSIASLNVCDAKSASVKDRGTLQEMRTAEKFLAIVYNTEGVGRDICYADSSVTCSCPDGYYCCYYGDPSCLSTCCPAGTVCGGP